jgi:hypothetical protein
MAGVALADDQAGTSFAISGRAQAVCGIGPAEAAGAPENMTLTGAGSPTVTIGQLIEPTSARLKPGHIGLKFRAVCNHPNYVSLTTLNGGLRPASTTSVVEGTFLAHVNYVASLIWGAARSELRTSGAALEATPAQFTNGAALGDLLIDIDIAAGQQNPDLPLIAGTYADTLVLRLGTQF